MHCLRQWVFIEASLGRFKLEGVQFFRLDSSTQSKHLDFNDAAIFVKVQDDAGRNFFGLDNQSGLYVASIGS
jgi:hypothetical protein